MVVYSIDFHLGAETIAHIKQLLSSPYSLLEISIQARFHDPSKLTRFFKKHTGLTPLQYRLRQPQPNPISQISSLAYASYQV
ncbi:helix-turn-helix domain-containing protein [Sphingobacterium sp. UT-1RO-CII-1]|uniref:helix-turn-helix domain-containing protein n=1 Tax=Sphingobacterium sp. UT-1RO-CII-1 TaxID=2995225 RepID=UPI003FA3645B